MPSFFRRTLEVLISRKYPPDCPVGYFLFQNKRFGERLCVTLMNPQRTMTGWLRAKVAAGLPASDCERHQQADCRGRLDNGPCGHTGASGSMKRVIRTGPRSTRPTLMRLKPTSPRTTPSSPLGTCGPILTIPSKNWRTRNFPGDGGRVTGTDEFVVYENDVFIITEDETTATILDMVHA